MITFPVFGENINHIQQLLSTKKCPDCDLTNAGLVMVNLTGANLKGANLVSANLSRANLTGADLRGANLTSATLYGANLTGANLTGAILNGTDLRATYLFNANLKEVDLNNSYLQGAIGIPKNASTPEQLYQLGLIAAQKQDHKSAIDYYNQSLSINPKFAPAYLGRGVSRYRLGDEKGASQDAEISSELFAKQNNKDGYLTSQNFIKGMEDLRNPKAKKRGGGFFDFLTNVGTMLLQLGLF